MDTSTILAIALVGIISVTSLISLDPHDSRAEHKKLIFVSTS